MIIIIKLEYKLFNRNFIKSQIQIELKINWYSNFSNTIQITNLKFRRCLVVSHEYFNKMKFKSNIKLQLVTSINHKCFIETAISFSNDIPETRSYNFRKEWKLIKSLSDLKM